MYMTAKRLFPICAAVVLAMTPGCGRAAKSSALPKSSRPVPVAASLGAGEKPELVRPFSSSSNLLYATFAANAPIVAAYGEQGTVGIWNTRTWILERTIVVGGSEHDRMYNAKPVALSPDGATFAYLTENGEVQLWDVKTGALRMKLPKPVGTAIAVIWSPDGRFVVGGGKYVRLWDAKSGRLVRTFSGSGDVAFSRNGKQLATAGVSGYDMDTDAHLFNVATGKRIMTLRDGSDVMGPVVISPDGKLIATGGEDPHWRLGPLPRDEEGNERPPTQAAVFHELKIKVWNARTGKRLRLLPGYSNLDGGAFVLQFFPDSRRLFSSGPGPSALWDVRTGRKCRLARTGASALSADGKMAAVAGAEGLLVIDAITGQKLFPPQAKPAAVRRSPLLGTGKK